MKAKKEEKSRSSTPEGPIRPIPISLSEITQQLFKFPSELSSSTSHTTDKALENKTQLAHLLLMITNSTAKESHVLEPLEPSPFHFDWNTSLKAEYEMVEKLHSPHLPQYTNLTSNSPSSSSDTKNMALIQVPKLQIQIPKVETSSTSSMTHYNAARSVVLCDEPVVGTAPPPPTVINANAPTVGQAQAQEQPPREPSTEAEESTDEDGNHNNSHQRSKRMRTSFKHHQLRAMKSYFALNHNPDAKDLKQLAAKTNLTKRVLQVWFQNARAKYRRGMQDNGHGASPLGVIAPLSAMDMNPPLSSSSSGHSTDGASYQLNTPPLSNEIYSPNNSYTRL
uniref:Homeobox domain-containing protein n=1 Tax=Caenorhabditis japonica TaxID=281687 RepID=A0A8R1I8H6_CAEJA